MNQQRRNALTNISGKLQILISELQQKDAIPDILCDQANLTGLRDMIDNLKDDEEFAYDNMPESFQNGDRGDAAQQAISSMEDAISELDDVLANTEDDSVIDALESVVSNLKDAVSC